MPTVTLNRQIFEKLVGKKLPDEKLKERISLLGTDLESVTDTEICVEIFPNRPDLLSEQGFARAFSSFIGVSTGLRKYAVRSSGMKVIIDKSVSKVRPFTACAIVKNLEFDDERIREVIQIQEKLHIGYGRNRKKCAIGIYPLEKIKMPIRYFAADPKTVKFRPLESSEDMDALQILSRHPAGREYAHLLEGKDVFPFFKDADDNILSMPPIINSERTGRITEDTKDVFIECSGFDLNVLQGCLNIIVTAFADMGGTIYSMELEYPDGKKVTPNLNPWRMDIDRDYINKRLGLKLSEKDIRKYLERMGLGYEPKNKLNGTSSGSSALSGSSVKVSQDGSGFALIPAYRSDIIHQSDLVEEVAIAYGYENFREEISNVPSIAQPDIFEKFKNRICNILIGLGLLEVNTYHISKKDDQLDNINLSEEEKKKMIELANALNEDFSIMRRRLFPLHLDVLKRNKHNEYPQRIFEIGPVFFKDKDGLSETGVKEEDHLSIVLCGQDEDYTKIRQVLDYLGRLADYDFSVMPVDHPSLIEGRAGKIFLGNKEVGMLGEASPGMLSNFEIEMPVALLELNITRIFSRH